MNTEFYKHLNGDITGVGKAPLRKRFSEYRQSRIARKDKFLGAKRIQDVKGIKSNTKTYIY